MNVQKFISAVADEKEGFSFDKPWRLEKKSLGVILPILRKSKKKRNYITLAEAQKVKVEDTGDIDHVYVKSEEDKPIYISRGEIFRGKTQERAAVHGYIVLPNQGLRVAVRCIHQTKGIQPKANMEYGGRTSYQIDLSSQKHAWDSVRAYSCSYLAATTGRADQSGGSGSFAASAPSASSGSMRASDDLVGTISDLSDSIREIMKKIPYIKNQTGAIFFKENSLVGMDVYDLSDSWDAVKKDVVEKEGASFLEKSRSDMFEFKPEKAKALAKEKLSVKFEEKSIYDREYQVVELRSENALGEAVIFKGDVIHLTLWKK